MTRYEAIFARRSVRSYDGTPPDEAVLSDLRALLDATAPLDGQRARFEIVPADRVNNPIAPYYILAFCAAQDGAYANVGYVLQNADLYLQSLGYGCCWQGMGRPSEADDEYCILLAFGKTDVPLRSGSADFKRLPLHEISSTDNEVTRAARLAPSAVNTQPWKLDCAPGQVAIRFFGRGAWKLVLGKKMNKIDVGIAARHVALALEHEGKTVTAATAMGRGKDFSVVVAYR